MRINGRIDIIILYDSPKRTNDSLIGIIFFAPRSLEKLMNYLHTVNVLIFMNTNAEEYVEYGICMKRIQNMLIQSSTGSL